jgi:glycosyltransferase involved in cell wall biosynthesis
MGVHVSVLIPTFNRVRLIRNVLEALRKQIYQDFEVIVILRPSGDGTEKILEQFQKFLKIRVLKRSDPLPITDALNIGLRNANGEIIAFVDDDAIPNPEWLHVHVKIYEDSRIGGIAGNVLSLDQQNIEPEDKLSSQGIYTTRLALENEGRVLWNRPISGLEDHFVFISKAGTVVYDPRLSNLASKRQVMSLLGMGCNMSVRAKAVKGLVFPSDVWVYGLGWEQYMGWWIKNNGYITVFEPRSKVKHITHQSISRNVQNNKKRVLIQAESDFLFYVLYGLEKQMSIMTRISWLLFCSVVDLKKICVDKKLEKSYNVGARFYFELLGIKWLLSRKFGGSYTPRTTLLRINQSIIREETSRGEEVVTHISERGQNNDRLAVMKKAGCHSRAVGIESGNDKMFRKMINGFTVQTAFSAERTIKTQNNTLHFLLDRLSWRNRKNTHRHI